MRNKFVPYATDHASWGAATYKWATVSQPFHYFSPCLMTSSLWRAENIIEITMLRISVQLNSQKEKDRTVNQSQKKRNHTLCITRK